MRLQNADDKVYWHLKPQLLVLTVHATNAVGVGVQDTVSYITNADGFRLDVGWCGIETTVGSSIAGALVLSDGGSGLYHITNTSAFRNYITDGLNVLLQGLLSNNVVSESGIFDFAGMDSIRSAQEMMAKSYVVSTSDGSFTIPFRNRLKISGGIYGGFSVRMCAITHLEPTLFRHRSSRRLMATDFTVAGRSVSRTPAPSSTDVEGVVFQAEPLVHHLPLDHNSTNNNTINNNVVNSHHDHDDHNGVYSWIGVIVLISVLGCACGFR